MCKQHFEEVLDLIAMIGANAPNCVEVVALVLDTERTKVQTIITNVDIDGAIDRFRKALAAAEEVKRQTTAGVAHNDTSPPTMQ